MMTSIVLLSLSTEMERVRGKTLLPVEGEWLGSSMLPSRSSKSVNHGHHQARMDEFGGREKDEEKRNNS